MDLNTVAGQWRSSYEGFVRTPEAVKEVIENYEEETKTRFVVDKKDNKLVIYIFIILINNL